MMSCASAVSCVVASAVPNGSASHKNRRRPVVRASAARTPVVCSSSDASGVVPKVRCFVIFGFWSSVCLFIYSVDTFPLMSWHRNLFFFLTGCDEDPTADNDVDPFRDCKVRPTDA